MMMTKRQLMDIRRQTWNAWSAAFRAGVPCSVWIKPAWRYDAPFNPEFRGAARPRAGEDY